MRDLAGEFRRRRIPCDAIHLDIHYMDGYRCFTWHPQRFPDPAALLRDLHGQGFKVVPLIDCGIKQDATYPVCASGLQEQVFCTLPDGQPVVGAGVARRLLLPRLHQPTRARLVGAAATKPALTWESTASGTT